MSNFAIEQEKIALSSPARLIYHLTLRQREVQQAIQHSKHLGQADPYRMRRKARTKKSPMPAATV